MTVFAKPNGMLIQWPLPWSPSGLSGLSSHIPFTLFQLHQTTLFLGQALSSPVQEASPSAENSSPPTPLLGTQEDSAAPSAS